MSHDQFPQVANSQEIQDDSLYSDRPGFIPDEFTADVIPFVPVIRGNNSIDHGWRRIGTQEGKVVLMKGDEQKRVSLARLEQAAAQWEAMQPPRTPEVLPTQVQRGLGHEAVEFADVEIDDRLTPEQHRQLQADIAAEAEAKARAEAQTEAAANASVSEKSLPTVEGLDAALRALENSMIESDRAPAWRYATAVHEFEFERARDQLSVQGQAQAREYRTLLQQLQKLRQIAH